MWLVQIAFMTVLWMAVSSRNTRTRATSSSDSKYCSKFYSYGGLGEWRLARNSTLCNTTLKYSLDSRNALFEINVTKDGDLQLTYTRLRENASSNARISRAFASTTYLSRISSKGLILRPHFDFHNNDTEIQITLMWNRDETLKSPKISVYDNSPSSNTTLKIEVEFPLGQIQESSLTLWLNLTLTVVMSAFILILPFIWFKYLQFMINITLGFILIAHLFLSYYFRLSYEMIGIYIFVVYIVPFIFTYQLMETHKAVQITITVVQLLFLGWLAFQEDQPQAASAGAIRQYTIFILVGIVICAIYWILRDKEKVCCVTTSAYTNMCLSLAVSLMFCYVADAGGLNRLAANDGHFGTKSDDMILESYTSQVVKICSVAFLVYPCLHQFKKSDEG